VVGGHTPVAGPSAALAKSAAADHASAKHAAEVIAH
jgi:hypothetical protein